MRQTRSCVFWFCVAVQLACGSWLVADEIETRDGKKILGTIQKEAANEVLILSQGKTEPQSVAVNRIAKVHYTGQPALLTHARSMEDAYELRTAAEEYSKVQAELKGKPPILQAAQFGEARVLALLALDESTGLEESISRLEKFAQENSDTRHHFPLQKLRGRLYFAKKDFGKAVQAFEELAKAPWTEARLESLTYQGRVLRAQSKLDQAIVRFDEVVATKPESGDQQLVQTEALLEKAKCLLAHDKREQEIKSLEQAIDVAPMHAQDIQAEAYIALGDAYRATQRPKDALLSFLHVELLFAKNKDLHARALYNLVQLWNELGQPDRAAAVRKNLKTIYPSSSWNKRLGSDEGVSR